LFSLSGFKSDHDKTLCFPENKLNLEDRLDRKDANLTEEKFNKIISKVGDYYSPIVKTHGAQLKFSRGWEDSTVNAYASQDGNLWTVAMFGGLARRPEVTEDGFALVVCHEMGHHIAGFPFYKSLRGVNDWGATEGQADYFSTQTCARNIWGTEHEKNAQFRQGVPAVVKKECNNAYAEANEQNLCYRTAEAGKSLADLLSVLQQASSLPQYETPDPKEVFSTEAGHPEAQCRLDTYFSGALCKKSFSDDIIPGRNHPEGQGSLEAELLASQYSCTDAGFFTKGKRPRCWYGPKLSLAINVDKVTSREVEGNGNKILEPGESFAINLPLKNNLLDPINGAVFSVGSQKSNYPKLLPGESSFAEKGLVVKIPDDHLCGSDVNISGQVSVGAWVKTVPMKFITGGEVESDRVTVAENRSIPDGDEKGFITSLNGEVHVATNYVEVHVDITHTYAGDMMIWLITPSGEKKLLFRRGNGSSHDIKETFKVKVKGEVISGLWQLKIADVAPGDIGVLNSWGMNFTTRTCQ
jgi:hypothetical protein